jgi:hypothetical protein
MRSGKHRSLMAKLSRPMTTSLFVSNAKLDSDRRVMVLQSSEPQYRCQTDNAASVSLAKSAGMALFGTWEVVSPEGTV